MTRLIKNAPCSHEGQGSWSLAARDKSSRGATRRPLSPPVHLPGAWCSGRGGAPARGRVTELPEMRGQNPSDEKIIYNLLANYSRANAVNIRARLWHALPLV